MCLPLTHKFSPWSDPFAVENSFLDRGYDFLTRITTVKTAQSKVCSKCNKVIQRTIGKRRYSERIR